MDESDPFDTLTTIWSGLWLMLIIAIYVDAAVRERKMRRLNRPGNAALGGSPTFRRIQTDPDGWKAKLAGKVKELRIVSATNIEAGADSAQWFNTFAILTDGETVDLDTVESADIAVTDATWIAELLGVPLEHETAGRVRARGPDANESGHWDTLVIERGIRRRRGVIAGLGFAMAIGLFYAAYRVYADGQAAYEVAKVESVEKIAALRKRNQRLQDLRHGKHEDEIPWAQDAFQEPLTQHQLDLRVEWLSPEPPEIPDTMWAFIGIGLVITVLAASRLRKRKWRWEPGTRVGGG